MRQGSLLFTSESLDHSVSHCLCHDGMVHEGMSGWSHTRKRGAPVYPPVPCQLGDGEGGVGDSLLSERVDFRLV